MKKFFLFLVTAGLLACGTTDKKAIPAAAGDRKAVTEADTTNITSIEWLDSIHSDLGKVREGQVVEVSYRFRNSGNKNLVFTSVSASCGCTVPEKPEKPYAPGEEGVIKAKFDSKGRQHGDVQKEVFVEANTNPRLQTLRFKVDITD